MAADIDDTETWDMPVRFGPRQHESGSCWIVMEQWSEPSLPILDEGFMGMHLAEETTFEEATDLADLLNRRVAYLMYSGPNRAAWADNPGRRARAKREDRDHRARAVPHAERAVQRLAAIVDAGWHPASARVAAARALLEFAYGRPARRPRANPASATEPRVVKVDWGDPTK